MVSHEKAYTKAYTSDGGLVARRGWRTGSLFQRCEKRYGCPDLIDGERPAHKCTARWYGSIDVGTTPNGGRKRVTVSGKSKSVVQRKLRDKQAERDRLGNAAASMKAKTVAKYGAEWLEMIETKVSPSAYTTDKAAMKRIVGTIGATRLRSLSVADVRAVAKAIRADGQSSSTALRYQGTLMRMLKSAALDGHPVPPNVLLADNPTAALNDKQAMEPEHYKAVLAELISRDTEGQPRHPDLSRWAVALLTGVRQKEALGLTWDHVDLDAGTITIAWQIKSLKYRERGNPAAGFVIPDGYEARHLAGAVHLVRPKSRRGWRVVPLVPWAVAALRDWREVAPENDLNLVWPGPYRRRQWWPRNPANDLAQWEAIQEAAGVAHPSGRPYGTHEIRHTTATLLLELKVPESVRMAIMGHASIEATQIYETVDQSLTRDALEGVSGKLELGQ